MPDTLHNTIKTLVNDALSRIPDAPLNAWDRATEILLLKTELRELKAFVEAEHALVKELEKENAALRQRLVTLEIEYPFRSPNGKPNLEPQI